MTPREFKAWFDGFTEAFSGCPTKAQWARIKERVAEIDEQVVTERIYLDRYYPHYSGPLWAYTTCNSVSNVGTNLTVTGTADFDSCSALYAVGRNDAAMLAA
jgi:hypothetical protein